MFVSALAVTFFVAKAVALSLPCRCLVVAVIRGQYFAVAVAEVSPTLDAIARCGGYLVLT